MHIFMHIAYQNIMDNLIRSITMLYGIISLLSIFTQNKNSRLKYH